VYQKAVVKAFESSNFPRKKNERREKTPFLQMSLKALIQKNEKITLSAFVLSFRERKYTCNYTVLQ
jgi:hypothetical protein